MPISNWRRNPPTRLPRQGRSAVRSLITGGTGFVGQHLCASLLSDGGEVFVFSIDPPPPAMGPHYHYLHGDLCDEATVAAVFDDIKPEAVYHLAAISAVPLSWQKPRLTFNLNVWGTFNAL